MTAAERAKALYLGEPADCPRCDAKLRVDRERLKSLDADVYGNWVTCASCGYSATGSEAAITGKPDDGTAKIHVEWKGGVA